MKITEVQTIPIGGMRFVRIITDEGITGLGEIPHFNPCANIAFAIQNMRLVGRDPLRIEQFWHETYHNTFFRGGPFWTTIISGVEQALWDIKGKQLGVPVNHLLGGPLRDRIKLYTHFGGNTPEECAESALGAVELGFRAIKTDPFRASNLTMDSTEMRKSVERIRATREAVGEDVDILIECHGFLNANTAIRVGQMLEEFEPFFYEEPVPPENVDEMAKVAASVNIPIAAGERLYTRWGFREYLEKQVVDYIQPDLCHCGGFLEGRKIAAMAEIYHVYVLPHNPNGPISTLVGVHLGACTPNFEMLEYRRPPRPTDELFKNMPMPEDGFLEIPGPGWGVELEEDALKEYPPET